MCALQNSWHTQSPEDLLEALGSSERGLSSEEAKLRLAQYGLNALPEAAVDGLFVIFLRQFQSPLIYILLAASAVVFVMGEVIDGSIILAVLVFNAIVGTIQEGKAQNTLLALKRFSETKATVLRDGAEIIISDTEVVPGDILVLNEGEKIPADARVITSHNLTVDEAALTGESTPAHKVSERLSAESSSSQYKNLVYKATSIVAGDGRAVVVATGYGTTIGGIARTIATIDTEIPLKTNIRDLSRLIIAVVAVVSAVVFLLGTAIGHSGTTMFATIVSLAVSIVPEGLPIVVTLILAMGVQRMSARNALVKKLQAVEALGQARVIAVDKTGTITKNELVIREVYVGETVFSIEGSGYEPEGVVRLDGRVVDAVNHPELLLTGKAAAFCAHARVAYSDEEERWRVSGDPTEAAILVLARKLGFHKEDLERESPLVDEIPFDYTRKYRATLHEVDDNRFLTAIGAPEVVLDLSTSVWVEGVRRDLTRAGRETLEAVFHRMSRKGLRVVAVAFDPSFDRALAPESIQNLTFLGFYGMQDAIRPEAAAAIRQATAAGMRVAMITGDHAMTARAIALEVGMWREGDEVLTGVEIDTLSEAELAEKLGSVSVFARVSPAHKLRIIGAYRAKGVVVAMTGDGVNDAPSLVAADLGVAMGRIGTEVAKEASDIVLLDDNLGSIVAAIEEGRGIYATIKKVILYLFSTSMGEVFVIVGALALGLPLPILPAQIIWLNFVTDGFLIVPLTMDPKEHHLLDGAFARPNKYLVDGLMVRRMALMSIVMALGTLVLFSQYYEADAAKAWTVSLTTLAVFQWFNVWNCRSDRASVFRANPFSNLFLVGATVVVIVLQLAAVYLPVFQSFLRTVPLDLSDWAVIVSVASSVMVAEEVRKWIARRVARGA